MDLNRIHYFFKAVEYKNFTQAANACKSFIRSLIRRFRIGIVRQPEL